MRRIFGLILLAAALIPPWSLNLAAPSSGQSLTVRVDTASGAPRLLVNGQPVRARMFFGGPGSAPIRIDAEARAHTFEFTAESNSESRGTLHFRFGSWPGEVFLDDVRVTDLESGTDIVPVADFEAGPESFGRAWAAWPTGAANTVGTAAVEPSVGSGGSAGLQIGLRKPADGNWPDWHIYHLPNMPLTAGHRYKVSFWARAVPARDVTVALYRPGATFVHLGGPANPFEPQIRMAAGAGVSFVSFPIPTPWPGPGERVDWTAVDNACVQVLRANPNALLVPRLGADPPDWWRQAYPEDTMSWEDGSHKAHGVVASPRYRRDASARVAALVAHLEEKFGDHMAGYHPCGQNTGEWFYEGTWEQRLNGYAPADRQAWRDWLKARYESDTALQRAWHDPKVTRGEAEVPSPTRRRSSASGMLRDPAAEMDLVDFAEFQQEAMAGLVCDLARAARQASGGRKLVVFFYGYLFEFGPIRLGPSTCGHYALRRVLASADIDVLCSPISYFDRGLGGSAPAMTAAESVALAGKMWLCEDDTRTYLGTGNFPGEFDGGKDFAETRTLLLRNVAQETTRNFATWWMDLGMTGWFNDQRFWDDMRRLEKLDRLFLDEPIAFQPEVAAVIDERAMLLTSATAWKVTEPGIYQARRALGRMGAPYGQYLLEDVVARRVPAKLCVFLNAWQLSSTQRQTLRAQAGERCSIWCYAPGMYDGTTASPAAMQELTGFQLAPVFPPKAWAEPTDAGRALGLKTPFGVEQAITPLFAASNVRPEETLARYPDGSAAVAIRKLDNGWSIFVGTPGLTSELLRLAARKANAHLYTDADCVVYANGPVVALHAAQDGPVTLRLNRPGAVHDIMTGERVGRGSEVPFLLNKGETKILKY